MLKIRLRRTGKRNQPHYRLVVAEHTAPIKGKFVAIVGHYNPRSKELVVQDEEITKYMDNGAKPSNTVARLLTRHGMKHKQLVIHSHPERPSKKEAAATDSGDAAPAQSNDTTQKDTQETQPDGNAKEKKEDEQKDEKKELTTKEESDPNKKETDNKEDSTSK